MSKRRLKSGNKVQFVSHDEKCQPFTKTGIVKVYIYPHFHPDGYIEVVDEQGTVILFGNADKDIIKKVKG